MLYPWVQIKYGKITVIILVYVQLPVSPVLVYIFGPTGLP